MPRRSASIASDEQPSGRSLVAPDATEPEERMADLAQRPRRLSEFVGQPEAARHLATFIAAAKARGEALDHVLFSGPPGLGKTTLAHVVAEEMGWGFVPVSGPSVARAGDLAAVLASMDEKTVVFIDEVHRLPKAAAELLYTAMEDGRLDLMVGEGSQARSVRLPLPGFTLVGATTRPGMLPRPMLDRFGISLRLEYYRVDDLAAIVARSAMLLGVEGTPEAWRTIAERGRGTPRVAKRLLRRVRDFAHATGVARLTPAFVGAALDDLGVDPSGLDATDRRYLATLGGPFRGGPTGIQTLAAATGDDPEILEGSVEPYLMARGLLSRTPRGRTLTPDGWAASGHSPPSAAGSAAGPLFAEI
jgi:Holliday junction DNA helicase RuvB